MADTLRPGERPWSLRWFTRTLRAGWFVLVAATAIGALLGLKASGATSAYQASSTLAMAVGTSATDTDTAVRSVASVVTSDAVVTAAATTLGVTPQDLSSRLRTEVQLGTTLIDVVVVDDSADAAAVSANAVAEAALAENRERQAAAAQAFVEAGEALLSQGQLSATAAEQARQEGIGALVGEEQGTTIQQALSLSLVAPAAAGVPAGVGSSVAMVLGAAAGCLLSALLLLSGALRHWRRVRRPADLLDLHTTARQPRVAANVGTLTGALLDSEQSCVVLVGAGRRDPQAGSATVAEVAALLRGQGAEPAVVVVMADSGGADLVPEGEHEWRVSGDAARQWLSRAGRRRIPEHLGADIVLFYLDAEDSYIPLLQGQSDFFCALVVQPGTLMSDVEAALVPIAAADPVVLLAPS